MIRPQPADWFEIVAAAEDADALVDMLSAEGCAEFEPATAPAGAAQAPRIFARLTGWTSDPEYLASCLDRSPARAVVHFPSAPEQLQIPLVLRNPPWIQPFEIFARLAGLPGRFIADPSGLLVIVAPILFGYMFGDVIQGAVLIALGLALQRRWPMLRLLVAGGVAACAFGFVFGCAGGIHGAVPALWVDPLESPLPVLAAPIAFGGVLLTIGLALTALEAYWRGRLRAWLCGDAGFILLYVGLLLAILHPAFLMLAIAGTTLSVFGRLREEHRIGAVFSALGELLEKLAQILINTLSFVRVGAFAMAHAGLSSALLSMAQTVENPVGYVALLVAGNLLIIAIEVLSASIQTTRLVLFEFFTRFFQPAGREFHPTTAAHGIVEEIKHVPRI